MDKPLRILVVDDELASRKFMELVLKQNGYEIVLVESGEEAIKLVEDDTTFDLILLDYLMVGLDGIEVLSNLKSNPKTRSIKVVMVSGLSDVQDTNQALSLGALGFLNKPLRPNDLVEKVNHFISLS